MIKTKKQIKKNELTLKRLNALYLFFILKSHKKNMSRTIMAVITSLS